MDNTPTSPPPVPAAEHTEAAAITPFRIEVPDTELEDLHARLDRTRWPAELPGDTWDLGVPVGYLRRLADYWRTGYDWPAQQAALNEVPQFTTTIEGQLIHFLHARSSEPHALPLVLTHGWPGSVVEFLDLIGPLTDPRAYGGDPGDAFHVVVPSLPGFGFSGPVTESWDMPRVAGAWAQLMTRLGYDRYATQGGDLGATVSVELGRLAPDKVIGVHVNGGPGPMPALPLSPEEAAALSELDRDRVSRIGAFMQEEFGYIAIQSTRPQTLAYGLTDSPVGQLAWIMDKMREWTHPRTTLPEDIINRDRLLTNVMFTWLTRTAGSATYVGYHTDAGSWGTAKQRSPVPTAALVLAHDVGIRAYAERENTITRWTDVDHGGHFAALEEPALLINDIREFFHTLR